MSHLDKFNSEHPSEVAHLQEGETYYALIDESYTSHDGYSERDGGGYHTTRYIDIIHLGNKEQALAWLHDQERARETAYTQPRKYKIVLMKPIHIQRSVSFDMP